MSKTYPEYKELNLSKVANEISLFWKEKDVFNRSVQNRPADKQFVFFEGPPSANGLPGIHHVMARGIKDIFCRYKTLKGYQVKRKAGWDTHGLPIELGVEKELQITKEDIGKKISVEDYNKACKKAVMKYTDVWNDLTEKMGYWVDMEHPYITYENKYIESVWWLLKQLYTKNLLYKGFTIQPYSPAAGTGLSSHELNQPGTYRNVKDTSAVAQFKLKPESIAAAINLFKVQESQGFDNFYFLAWTTTPWTLPSNTALAVGSDIDYVLISTFNQYTYLPINVIVAKDLVAKHFSPKGLEVSLNDYTAGDKVIPYKILGVEIKGIQLVGLKYEQLMPYTLPMENAENAFQVIKGGFVTTEDGTGIVHIAPTFGADDAKVAKEAGVPAMLVPDENGNPVPLVNLQGKFVAEMKELAGLFVKNEYYKEGEAPEKSADILISIMLKEQNKAFKIEKYEHSYPHCWRTDKPILYYPLDAWFVKTTAVKNRMVDLNKTINWKPESTGTGRFGNWLENVNDWNLSRSRFWGIPIPIWRTEDGLEEIIIGSVEELKAACKISIEKGFMKTNPLDKFIPQLMSDENYHTFDLHKNYVDEIILVSENGKPMKRETDLIDVWFDSGAMPYAQWHYPFENKELIDNNKSFPADFIAEGVDQTRGWFYTLHAIATMCFDSVAYKNVISNGLVLDKNGQKMSKRLGNAADPFATLEKYGPDATRWYMISNAQPWDNLKFDLEGIQEVQRKFFGTIYNTYSFFALYANVDNFAFQESEIPLETRPEIDRWILSKLNSLIKSVDSAYFDYEPTKAARLIQEFVSDHLSNWYVRLCRRRFWKGDYSNDKIAAYQTLCTCLQKVALISSPIAPFFMDQLFQDLNIVTKAYQADSVHLCNFPIANEDTINKDLEERMEIAQKISSMVLALRKKEKIKVRQPLQKIMVPALDDLFEKQLILVKDLILSEVNVKELQFLKGEGVLVKKIKPNFKVLGPKHGQLMKEIANSIALLEQAEIKQIELTGRLAVDINSKIVQIDLEDVEITTEDVPGWIVASEGKLTVALDITISKELRDEGIARDIVNKIQTIRKERGFDVTDRITIKIQQNEALADALKNNLSYICNETLANSLQVSERLETSSGLGTEIVEGVEIIIEIEKI
jgi:isoleucyl-tRNA synthetase